MVKVGVVRKKDIIQAVKTSVKLVGGMKIQKNSTALIRPNTNTADYPPGSTNPEVLKGAIRAVKEYKPAKIIIAEKSKTHWTALFTMGLKSQISITSDLDRRQLHHGQNIDELFCNMIAESNLVHKPDFYISDATKCFVTDGPNAGTLREPGIVMASSDVIANDVVGLAFLKTLDTIHKKREMN